MINKVKYEDAELGVIYTPAQLDFISALLTFRKYQFDKSGAIYMLLRAQEIDMGYVRNCKVNYALYLDFNYGEGRRIKFIAKELTKEKINAVMDKYAGVLASVFPISMY
jgi:hypothetical protein